MFNRDTYMPGPDGKMYQIVRHPDGQTEAYPVEDPEAQFEEITEMDLLGNKTRTGWYHKVQDREEAKRQHQDESHRLYFGIEPGEKDPAKIKQRFRRLDHLETLLTQITMDRMSPVGVPQVRYIKDEQFLDLMGKYKKAVLVGEEKEFPFQPLSSYQHKLVLKKTGKMLRPVFRGEVGMYGAEILCLEQGYGGSVFSVSAAIERDQEEARKEQEAEARKEMVTTPDTQSDDWEFADEEGSDEDV